MYTNIVRYGNTVVFVYDGSFEECVAQLEKHFGKCHGWNIASGHGTLQFPNGRNFTWDSIEKNILFWDTLKWGRSC